MIYNVTIGFERHRLEEYKLECDTDAEAIEKAQDLVIDGFVSICASNSDNGASYCNLNIKAGERKIYDGTLYPCDDGLTEDVDVFLKNRLKRKLGDYSVDETSSGAILTAEDGKSCVFRWRVRKDPDYFFLEWDEGDLEIDDREFQLIPELVKLKQKRNTEII